MKHAMRFLVCGLFAAIPLFLLSGCYTQVGTARGDFDEGYEPQVAANDQAPPDSTQPGDYDSARRDFYNDSYYYPSDYPAYSVGIGFGWAPWYGYAYPWYFYDGYPWYGGFYPFGLGFAYGYGGYHSHGGGFGYYGRGYATRRFGMARTTGGTRGIYATPGSPLPAGRTGAIRGTASTGRTAARGAVVSGTLSSRGRAATRVSPRSQSGMRGPSSRSAPSGRSGGRGYSSPSGHGAPSGGGGGRGGSSGGGGGSRSGGGSSGGGGGSRGGGGRR